jgi:hypothetical protein
MKGEYKSSVYQESHWPAPRIGFLQMAVRRRPCDRAAALEIAGGIV